MKKEINADLGIVDILVNNAGLMPQTSFRGGDPNSIKRVMDVNVLSHFWVNLLNYALAQNISLEGIFNFVLNF